MELRNLELVNAAVALRRTLVLLRSCTIFDVVIAGKYQDDAMNDIVRPVVMGELERRIAVVTAELRGLGVVIDEGQPLC